MKGMNMGYQRVSRKNPCRICGKPDWCSITLDLNISFCARSSKNADRLSRNGWGIYYGNEKRRCPDYVISARPKIRTKQFPIAPIDLRHKIYQILIKVSPLSDGNELGLGSAWFNGQTQELNRYGLLPKAVIERHRLVRLLIESLIKDNAAVLEFNGVPGFWRDSNGGLRLGYDFDSADELLLIPFYDSDRLIQACQIRIMRQSPNTSGKYLWLSSIGLRDGSGPGTPLHHEGAVSFKGKTIEKVLVTEGALKAATVQAFLPDRYVIGNSGVATSHREIIKTARRKILEIAFDADCFTNPHVARALGSLIALRTREQQFLSYDHPTTLLTWDRRFKGIDDALIAGSTVKNLHVSEWLRSLTPDCFEAVNHQLGGISL